MYESSYGLRRRPFAAAADPTLLVELPAVAAAAERLDRCVRDGAGVAILTAAAGLGKTHLCQWLARRWAEEFAVVFLPNAAYPSRRSLLQAVVYELGRPQQRLGEAELRSELAAAARERVGGRTGVVLILDEAHRYSERLLDEVRAIANLVEGGQPLVRIMLAGRLELEEKLAEAATAGLNDRVGTQVSLPRLTAAESTNYLQSRTALAGGDLQNLFTPAAVDVLVRACGGVPRCLNQLADHSLLLGYVAERRPVDEPIVREALDDLKRLPLQWADPLPAEVSAGRTTAHVESAPSRGPEEPLGSAIEFGGELDSGDEPDTSDRVTPRFDFERCGRRSDRREMSPEPIEFGDLRPVGDDFRTPAVPANRIGAVRDETPRVAAPRNGGNAPPEESIGDRYAGLDAAERRRQWLEWLERTGGDGSVAEPDRPAVIASPPTTVADSTVERPAGQVQEASPAAAATPAAHEKPSWPAERPAVDPLALLDRLEPLVADALGDTLRAELLKREASGVSRPVIDRAVELERLVQALERATVVAGAAPAAATSTALSLPTDSPGRCSTLFRDMRRRQAESR